MSDHELSEGEREGPQELSSPQAVEKLKAAAEIANAALRQVLARVVPGADVFELCLFGDLFVAKEAAKVYQRKAKAKKIEKGIAVPTCVSVNEMFANFSPCDRSASLLLREGDLVKVHLGAHIDGFVAAAAYSVICCSSNAAAFSSGASPAAAAAAQEAAAALQETLAALPPAPEEYRQQQQQLRDAAAAAAAAAAGPAAAVLKACWLAAEAALRKVDVGAKASEVTKAIEAVAEDMGVKPMHGVLCYQMKQHVIEGSRCFPIVSSSAEDKQEDFTFEANELYSLDVVLSAGEGRARESAVRPSVFKRAVERKYILKSQLGRAFMNQVENNFPTLPFSLRQLADERASKVGVAEAMRHELITPYVPTEDRGGALTAQFKCTVHLTPSGVKKVTGLPFVQERLLKAPDLKREDLKALLAVSLNPKKNKKKQKSAAAEASS